MVHWNAFAFSPVCADRTPMSMVKLLVRRMSVISATFVML